MPVRRAACGRRGRQPEAAASSAAVERLFSREGSASVGEPGTARASAAAPWQEKRDTRLTGLCRPCERSRLQLRREPQQRVVDFPGAHHVSKNRLDNVARPAPAVEPEPHRVVCPEPLVTARQVEVAVLVPQV